MRCSNARLWKKHLFALATCAKASRMGLWSTLRRLLPALAIAGLVLAPVSQPGMAMPADMQASMSDHAEMADHAAMAIPDGMPCCPHEQQKPDCGKDCPLMAMC